MNVLMRMRLLATASLFLALVTGVSVGAITAGGIGGRPANPDPNNPRTQSIFIMKLEGGAVAQDAVKVLNNSGKTQQINLYAVDGVVTNTGAYTCRQQDDVRSGVGSWTKLSKTSLTIKTGESVDVPFSVKVPKLADVGEHNGCIVFENSDQGDSEAKGNVRIKTRQAVRLVVTVPGDLKRNIEIDSFVASRHNNGMHYDVSLKNSGNVSADTDVSVVVKSLFGNKVYENGGGYPVLPNQKLDLSYVQESVPFFGGWYQAQAIMKYNNQAGSFGTDNNADMITKKSDQRIVFVAPTIAGALLMLGALLALIGAGVFWKLRRDSNLEILQNGAIHKVKKGETIQSIADEYQLKWQKLAVVNRIKPPYTLSVGSELRVPKKPTVG